MDRNSNVYTFIYASGMVILVAAILSLAASNLKPFQDKNIEIEKKQNILSSVNIAADATNAEEIYAEKIVNSYIVNSKGEKLEGNAFTVDLKKERAKESDQQQLPVFECQIDGDIKYIVPLRGAGLWGPIWGYLALNSDMSTIYGASFDHQGETPGLGAEISTQAFQSQFKGKEIYDDGELVSITVAKSNESAPEIHKVDAISGGTITSKGLQNMIYDDLSLYNAFFNQNK
ncbi:NADH:ubiquinone reductase (Na(+)-transporting) subunit C [uncultured Sunxiuqinia sp.]|uniref:NADH:ubiquinone reductase (Na(+)-transporting) subunit C n=1 Tax=uncultured Sunxiuqinia sp. TaxID=1573825 RepID=UPI002AA6134A|nr:NADH:ubiquinone reductase (Na(+)-transporting) subunit C [uncultured Sunxiuqinia sp.]